MFYSLNIFCVGFMVSEIPRVSVFGYFPLYGNVEYTDELLLLLFGRVRSSHPGT